MSGEGNVRHVAFLVGLDFKEACEFEAEQLSTESLKAWRAKATLFSVLASSSWNCIMFSFAFRSGYASDKANSRPNAAPSAPSEAPSFLIASAFAGSALAACRLCWAELRALITASRVSLSCFM
jgi:hypothetical protein